MDTIDFKALSELMMNGRMTWAELGSCLGLSSPATAERVRRLEDQGVIKGFTALVDHEAVGCALTAFVAVSLERPEHRNRFLQKIMEMQEVQECHHVAGEDDYLLKVRCKGTRDLERVVSDTVKSIPGVARTRTTIVMSTPKETPSPPLFPEDIIDATRR
ncbi:MAG: Lrp/AsnC family transcriptional regulator [Sulfobacillus benefaciens]|uniref:Lrp/AsnC family transcriptional regulator n=1 Tax=Sulfobacillus benefaciens TaxID=453960 RepID=A0A2T2WQ26_9FIRM|nr:MAG: Lrp/AsnC family transcriptional regulator [Sulfobacillus benefaciens]